MKIFQPLLFTTFLASYAAGQVVQTYFVPLPEDELFSTFSSINTIANSATSIKSLISIAIAASDTIIYYDHWEDGYDPDPTGPNKQPSTEIWGDQDVDTGSSPKDLVDADDFLASGRAIILDNDILKTRTNATLYYDGKDRILASLPIAVTRSAYPNNPGSLMAGAVEVFNRDAWGTNFIAPVGENTIVDTSVSCIR